MNNVIGICNLHDAPHLGLLTEKRPLGAVTFLGRYALMDFTLSNFSNSGIDKVDILTDNFVHAVRNHVTNGQAWISNTKTGYQRIYSNEGFMGNPKFNTDLNNLLFNVHILSEKEEDYVVFVPSFFICKMDYRPIINAHIKSKAEATVVYVEVENADEEFLNCDALELDGKKVAGVSKNTGLNKTANISLETFVFNRKYLVSLIKSFRNYSALFSLRDYVNYLVNNKAIKLNTYRFEGFVAPILSLENYVKYSLSMLNFGNRQKLFSEDWPIYTTTHNTPPTLYGPNAEVSNSFIANGSIIKGKVVNSIISRDVLVDEGASVENCILFTKTQVGKDVKLKFILTDKNVKIQEVQKLEGSDKEYIYVKTGDII